MTFDTKTIHEIIQPTHSHASHCHYCNVDFALFHNVTCYTICLLSSIRVNTTQLLNITCTVVARSVMIQTLECTTYFVTVEPFQSLNKIHLKPSEPNNNNAWNDDFKTMFDSWNFHASSDHNNSQIIFSSRPLVTWPWTNGPSLPNDEIIQVNNRGMGGGTRLGVLGWPHGLVDFGGSYNMCMLGTLMVRESQSKHAYTLRRSWKTKNSNKELVSLPHAGHTVWLMSIAGP